MNTNELPRHHFFCECSNCCTRYDTPFSGSAVMTDTRPLVVTRTAKAPATRTRYMEPGQKVGRGTVRRPSDKQLAFLRKLLDTKDLTGLTSKFLPAGVDIARLDDLSSISLRGCSDLIERLLNLNDKASAVRMMTDGQEKFIRSLIERKYVAEERACMIELIETGITFKQASVTIEFMKKRADVAVKVVAGSELEEGVYRFEGNAARVVRSDAGRMYASLWNADTQDWDYTSGLVSKIKADDRMTLEQISKFGQAFGRCGHCNRKLTRKESMEAGIGPKCATMY